MQYLLLIAAAAAADQLLKWMVIRFIGMLGEIPVIPGFFYLHVIPNDGIAMGMLADYQKLVIGATAVMMAALGVYIFLRRKKDHPWLLAVLSMITGGGIGNIIDRIRLGYVVDYLDFRIWPYIFNFADICIVAGCFALILLVFFDSREERTQNHE